MLLSDLLAPARVKVPLTARDKEGVLRELLELALPERDSATFELVLDALRQREEVLSTGIGEGVGIPHAKTPLVDEVLMAAGVSPAGVEFDALDGEPAHLFFLLLGPESAAAAHIKALSRISRLLRREPLRRSLCAARSPEEFLQLVTLSEAG
ncbi:MAG TPA: PTS sugar transporter subunit IIA [Gemmatimonadaceae bacterium]|nr:PTS sugar transporter subunit IIA [Gemmatimonadaceae bacterium]